MPNTQNDFIKNAVINTGNAIGELINNRLTIVSVNIGDRRPVITIENSPACKKLKGAVKIRRNTPTGRINVMTALVNDCQVQWQQQI